MRKVSEKQKQSGATDEESLRQSANSEFTSIMEDADESVFLDQESGIRHRLNGDIRNGRGTGPRLLGRTGIPNKEL